MSANGDLAVLAFQPEAYESAYQFFQCLTANGPRVGGWRGDEVGYTVDVVTTGVVRELTALELEREDWPSVAEDVRDGLSAETILRRLRDIGEEESSAYEIMLAMDNDSSMAFTAEVIDVDVNDDDDQYKLVLAPWDEEKGCGDRSKLIRLDLYDDLERVEVV